MRHDRLAAAAIAACFALTCLGVAGRSSLFDRDEPRFARAAVEMVQSGNYLYPTFNGELRAAKPAGVYWLMSVPLRLIGQREIAVRLPSILALAGTLCLVFWMGRRIWNPRVALTAMAVMATTPLSWLEGSAATADGTLLFFLTAAMAVIAHAITAPAGWRWGHVAPLGLALGGAALVKGPLAVLPLLSILMIAVMTRKDRRGPGLVSMTQWSAMMLAASAVAAGVFLLWGIPANLATQGRYAQIGLGHDVLARASVPLEGHGGSWFLTLPFYLFVTIAAFFPWTLYALGALGATLGGRLNETRQRPGAVPAGRTLIIAWTVPTFVAMSVVATKLPHYILPIWPALALAVAATLDAWRQGRLTQKDLARLRWGGLLVAPAAIAAIAALVALPWYVRESRMWWPCLTTAAVMLAWMMVTLRLHFAWRFGHSAIALAVGMALMQGVAGMLIVPAIETLKPVPALARAIRARTAQGVPVFTCGYGEPSLNFYLDRWPIRPIAPEAVAAWTAQPGPAVLVIPRKVLDRTGIAAASRLEIARAPMFDPADRSWNDLVALRRGG